MDFKFRCWDKENSLMVFSDDGLKNKERSSLLMITLDGEAREIYRENLRSSKGFELFDLPLEKNKVLLNIYIGQKDRNGKEIYEGDILNGVFSGSEEDAFLINNLGFIQYCNKCSGFQFFMKWKNSCNNCEGNFGINEIDLRKSEISGNIYENPNLLDN